MELSPNARVILSYIVEQLDCSRDRESFFLTYKQVHTALGLPVKGNTLGRSLDAQGLGELADWAYANDLPAVTGLIIKHDEREPGLKFYAQNKREPNDLKFWLEHAKRSREFDWKPHLNPVRAASPKVPIVATPDRGAPQIEQGARPVAASEAQAHRTFLLVWNPKSYDWKSLKDDLGEFYQSLSLVRRWGVANLQAIRPKDRVFLVRVGGGGAQGIMASGYSISVACRGGVGVQGNYVNVEFDMLIDPMGDGDLMISLEALNSDPILADQTWTPPRSGISISQGVADRLESLWRSRLNYLNGKALLAAGGEPKAYYEGRSYEIVSRRYERDPEARLQCLSARGYRCLVCFFDFKEAYGELGEGFIHVHHLTPIHSRQAEYRVDPELDLIPVCPNCHAMLHRQSPPLTVKELQQLMKYKKRIESA